MRTDSAIKDKSDDILGRYNFAVEIVNGLLKSFNTGQESIAIGINGEWGSGKSSILEFIETEIRNQTKNEKTNIIFRFNPWLFTGQADLQKSFLTQLGVHLKTINPELRKLGEDIILVANIIDITNSLNPEFLSKSIISTGSKVLRKLAEKIGNEPSIQTLKERIDKLLETSKIKVFIIIDDIDRLIPSEIANIFRLVKLNANFSNTFFFVAYDKSVVIKALDSEFQVEGEHFLEKIIQLDYSIPKISLELLEELFMSNINKLAGIHKITYSKNEMGQLWNSGLKLYFSNLRHIYRYFNALEVRYPGMKDDVNIIDFSTIEAIRMFDYKAFEWIYQHKEDFFPVEVLLPTGLNVDNDKDFLDEISENKDIPINDNTKQIIISIFKSIHFNELSFRKNKIDYEKLEKEKRIAHKDYFEHYFSFKVSSNNIAQVYINKFFKSEYKVKEELLREFKGDKFSIFLKRLIYNLTDINAFPELYKFFLDFSDKEEMHLFNNYPFGTNGLYIIKSFLNDVAKKFGFNEFLDEILSSNSSYSRFNLQGYLRNKLIGSQNIAPVKDFPNELIESKRQLIIESFQRSLNAFSELYLANPHDYDIFLINDILRLIHEENIDQYRKIISEFMSDIEKALILFRCSLTVLTGDGNVSYSLQNHKYILPELTIDQFDKVIGLVALESYNGRDRNFLALFHRLKENNFNPNYHFTIDLKKIEF